MPRVFMNKPLKGCVSSPFTAACHSCDTELASMSDYLKLGGKVVELIHLAVEQERVSYRKAHGKDAGKAVLRDARGECVKDVERETGVDSVEIGRWASLAELCRLVPRAAKLRYSTARAFVRLVKHTPSGPEWSLSDDDRTAIGEYCELVETGKADGRESEAKEVSAQLKPTAPRKSEGGENDTPETLEPPPISTTGPVEFAVSVREAAESFKHPADGYYAIGAALSGQAIAQMVAGLATALNDGARSGDVSHDGARSQISRTVAPENPFLAKISPAASNSRCRVSSTM